MTLPKRLAAKTFLGLNNVSDKLRLKNIGWLTQADNVIVTPTQALERAKGYTRSTTNTALQGAYATKDLQRLYLIDNGELRRYDPGLTTYSVLRSGLSPWPYSFDETNGVVYYSNGVDLGMITADSRAMPWGIEAPSTPYVVQGTGSLYRGVYSVVTTRVDADGLESSNSPVTEVYCATGSAIVLTEIEEVAGYTNNVYVTQPDGTIFFLAGEDVGNHYTITNVRNVGRELPYWNTNTPRGGLPCFFQGRMHTAEWFPELDITVIWRSLPLQYHHFDPGQEAFTVPGQARFVDATGYGPSGTGYEKGTLIIGTDRQVWGWTGENLVELAAYGVVPGWHASLHKDHLYFWTLRGLCRAMPFMNLTEGTVSVPPGLRAGGTVVEKDGMRRYVVALIKGGEAYNRRES